MSCKHDNKLEMMNDYNGNNIFYRCIKCMKKSNLDDYVRVSDILPYLKDTSIPQVTDFCNRIIKLVESATKHGQRAEILEVLQGFSNNLEEYEEIYD